MAPDQTPRILTYDERKAAEAAFAGRPFDPVWSESARTVYEGILTARGLPAPMPISPEQPGPPGVPASTPAADAPLSNSMLYSKQPERAPETPTAPAPPQVLSREDAIQAGALIDVTPIAHTMGLRLPVSFSRPLWEIGITAAQSIPKEEYDRRVRDVLMAFRLRLAASRMASPLVEFPPDPVPQTCVLFAVAHQETDKPTALTFLLPGEVSTTNIPFSVNE
ncbi:MAG TPA: hypothetical protein VES96_01975 [Nitrospiraceae bacterium]|nr:hypothetical protein [Nitrospiraceae bacterium]